MKLIESFHNWVSNNSLNENIKAAKLYMQNRLATAMRKEGSSLTPEETAQALSDPEYLEIIEMLKDHPGYALPFVKFHFEQDIPVKGLSGEGESITSLEGLLKIIKEKGHIIQQLSTPVEKRALDKFSEGTTGFEKLTDEIRTIERAKSAKWFIDSLPRTLRDQYRALNKEKQAAVITLALQLNELGRPAIDRLFKKIKAMADWTIENLIDYTRNYVKGYMGQDMSSKIKALEAIDPEAGILYSDDRYLVMSMRTENAQKSLCSIANWCINRGSFESYAKDGVQLNIFDFELAPGDPMYLTGTTVYYNGKVNTSHDSNDDYIKKSNELAVHLKKLGYPNSLVSAVLEEFDSEAMIKKIVYDLNMDKSSPVDLLKNIILQSYGIDPFTRKDALEVVLHIIETRIKQNLTKSQALKMYREYGVLSKFSAQVLKMILSDLNPKEMKSIVDATLSIFSEVNLIAKEDPSLVSQQMKNILSQEEEVAKELGLQ